MKKIIKTLFLPLLVILVVSCGGNGQGDSSTVSSNQEDSSVISSNYQNIPAHEVFDYDDIFAKDKAILSTSPFTLLPKHVSNDYDVIVTDLGYFIEAEASGATIIYRNIINLYEVEGNLVEFEAYHNETSNFGSIEVSLIDIYDENTQFKVIFTQNPNVDNQSRIAVSVNGKVGAMNNVGSDNSYTSFAVNYRNNFNEVITPDYTHSAFNFSFDTNTNQIYSTIDSKPRFMLLDLTDKAVLGNSVFTGFKTNEVYVKIEFKAVDINSNAQIAITKLGNRFFNDEIKNIESNLIKLNINPNYFDNNLPSGVINEEYKIPVPIYNDYLLGDVRVDHTLKFNGQDKTNLINNYSFTPEQTGTYVLEYQAIDIYGNDVKRTYDIEVLTSKNPINVEFETKTFNIFEESELPLVYVSGGHGELETTIKYYFNDKLIEDEIYTFDEIGTLKVEVKVNDYLSQNKEFTKNYQISGKTVLNIIDGVPKAIFAGTTYKISEFEAIDYSIPKGSAGYYLEKSVYVDGVKLNNIEEFEVPTNKDQIVMTFFGGKGTAKEISQSFLVKILDEPTQNDASGYFMSEDGMTATQSEDGVLFSVSKNATTISAALPNGVVAHEFGIEFLTKTPNYSHVEFILTDYFNANKQVKIRFYKADKNTFVRLQDSEGNFTKSYVINDVFTSNKPIIFYLDNKNGYLLDYYYSNIAKVEYYDDGTQFRGFESNAVFVELNLGLVRSGAEFVISRVGNQSLKAGNLLFGDTNAPQISFLDEFKATSVGINTKYLVPAAKAYDVLQSNSYVTLTITDPDGLNVVKDTSINKAMELTLDKYGIYRLVYTTVDSASNLKRYTIMVTVIDELAPTIEINGTYKDTYKVGETITLLDFTVTDNLDESSAIGTCIFIRNMKTYELHQLAPSDNFTFTHDGDYEIIYYAIDTNKNVAREVINIKVR